MLYFYVKSSRELFLNRTLNKGKRSIESNNIQTIVEFYSLEDVFSDIIMIITIDLLVTQNRLLY